MSGTIFFICSTSAIPALFLALRISAWLDALKRCEEDTRTKREDRIVAKSKSMAMNLTSTGSTSSSSVNLPITSKSSWKLIETGKQDEKKFKIRRTVEFSKKAERCIPWRLIVEVAEKPAATGKSQESWESYDSESWSSHQKEVTAASQKTGKQRVLKLEAKNGHTIFMSPAVVLHMEKVHLIVRQNYGRSPTDELNDLDVNNAVWSIFMNVTLHAAVHLGRDYVENLRFAKNQLLKSMK